MNLSVKKKIIIQCTVIFILLLGITTQSTGQTHVKTLSDKITESVKF